MKHDFCSFCGTEFAVKEWPRKCGGCRMETFLNPTPVVVVLQPVWTMLENGSRDRGVIIGQRAIQPAIGEWSLISGYMNVGETAEEAAKREFLEETSLEVEDEPRYAYSTFNQHNLLMLCYYIPTAMSHEKFLTGKPCSENLALGVRWAGQNTNLAFPLQSEFTERYMRGEFDGR